MERGHPCPHRIRKAKAAGGFRFFLFILALPIKTGDLMVQKERAQAALPNCKSI
jgi:hypothetical protein